MRIRTGSLIRVARSLSCFTIVLLNISCLSLRISLDLQADEDSPGSIVVEYMLSDRLLQFGSYKDPNITNFMLPLKDSDAQALADRIAGLDLTNYKRSKDKKNIVMKFSYSNSEALNLLFNQELELSAKSLAYSTDKLSVNSELESLAQEQLAKLFNNETLEFTVSLPKNSQLLEQRNVDVEGQSISFKKKFTDIINDGIDFSMRWD